MRKIIVFSTQDQKLHKLQVSATTAGELKTALENGRYETISGGGVNFDLSNMDVTIKETGFNLNFTGGAEAELPSGQAGEFDFTAFLIPRKVKSGNWTGLDSDSVTLENVMKEVKDIKAMLKQLCSDVEVEQEAYDSPTREETEEEKMMREAAKFM